MIIRLLYYCCNQSTQYPKKKLTCIFNLGRTCAGLVLQLKTDWQLEVQLNGGALMHAFEGVKHLSIK